MLIFLLIVVAIIIIAIVVKKSKEKADSERREKARIEKEQALKAKKEKEDATIEKYKANSLVQEWSLSIAKLIEGNIAKNPYTDWEFHFRAYCNEFAFGTGLKSIYLKYTDKFVHQKNYSPIFVKKFAEFGLEEIPYDEIRFLSMALASLTLAELEKIGIKGNIETHYTILDNEGFDSEICNEKDKMAVIIYERKKAEGTW